MLYSEYEIVYYYRPGSLKSPAREYIENFGHKERAKLLAYIKFLWKYEGRLPPIYTRHIYEKIWELRIKYNKHNHRILYFIAPDRKIVLLSAFLKKSNKTPQNEIKKAYNYYLNYIS